MNASSNNDLLWQPLNDYGNAQRLLAMYGDDLKYCPPMRKFLVWDGCRFNIDEIDEIRNRTHLVMLEFAKQALDIRSEPLQSFAGKCLNSPRITAAMRELQPMVPVMPVALDTDPYLLNFKNGTVDLRTGKLQPHSRNDLITKLVQHEYKPEADCPRFLTFLNRTVGTKQMVAYLLKVWGYSLTGVTQEKAVFLLHGDTDTGKTTLLQLWHDLLGEYSTQLDIESLMTKEEDNNSRADLAKLRGARFAMTSETKRGQQMSEAKMKRICQGQGTITTVRKYEDWITFPETHKLHIDANHRPDIRDPDDAIWNRMVVIPCPHRLSETEIDRELPGKLREEAQGILALGVKNSILWSTERLGKVPLEAQAAKNEWRTEMDRLKEFLESATVRGNFCKIRARVFYTAYCDWCKEAGEEPLKEKPFSQRLKEMGFQKKSRSSGIFYIGIGLRADMEQSEICQTEASRP